MDKVRKYTDEQLKKLEKRLAREYSSAKKELEKKWKEYMAQVKKQLQPYEAAYNSAVKGGVKTEIADAKAALDNMKRSLTLSSPRYDEMVDNLTDRMAHVNETALAYINDKVPDLYIANHNAIAPTAQSLGIDFTLINKNTLKNVTMARSLPLPKKLNIAKDKRWNAKKMNSSLLQGILQGESMDKIAARMNPIVGGNQAAAIRSARTMVTQAENKGRLDSYHELEDMGTIMKKRWIATADEVTRESHLEMDGEEVDLDDTFSNGLMYPGDPDGDPGEVYNCRCTMETVILGFMDADGNINYIDESLHEDTGHHEQIEEEIERREEREGAKGGNPVPDDTGAMRGVPKIVGDVNAETVVESANPQFNESRAYRENCANCVVATELRFRGYDVTARCRSYSRSSNVYRFWYNNEKGKGSWTDSFSNMENELIKAGRKNAVANKITEKMVEYGEGSRAAVFIQWDGKTVGHYFNVVNEKGVVKFIDSQNGNRNAEEYFNRVQPSKTRIWRMDDKKIDEFARKVVKWNE